MEFVFIMLSKFKTEFSVIIHECFIFSLHLEGNQYISIQTSCCPSHGAAAKFDLGSRPTAESPENPVATGKLVQISANTASFLFIRNFHVLGSRYLWSFVSLFTSMIL